jgi:hypothetical protein
MATSVEMSAVQNPDILTVQKFYFMEDGGECKERGKLGREAGKERERGWEMGDNQ